MRIVVDAMGGDNGVVPNILGAIEAAKIGRGKFQVILVGDTVAIKTELASGVGEKEYQEEDLEKYGVKLVHASQRIEMHETPTEALRNKRDSSISVGLRLQKRGEAEGFISAGNTGAVMGASLFELGRIEGVSRPAIATFMPTELGGCIVVDAGANPDCKPHYLLQFGMMGASFAHYVFEKPNPKVGLLSVGEEASKGDELTVKSHQLLAESGLNFIGNIEGKDILKGTADVVVCDGFVGNVILKFAESVVRMFYGSIKRYVYTNIFGKIGALLLKPALKKFAKDLDYEEYGGAPLLGVNGVCIICHGRSTAKAIKNAILVAHRCVSHRVNDHIKDQLSNYAKEVKK
ncbi:MAG: phosphate acyltransferase PlsX [Candidatus Edwardsbacteria bacterium]|nr:phosphate acyltransferase PlsX [Candidatus Edwardsbacteria bacterium]MBU1576201.1 phosphate acyltransferase PlsX [Candidatus Edwardsbacteria bacterium]MBU2462854.1 phosphate acyltransferase PlsX [Candidatus Edwardsbacteria bacterium]MBU2593485.1 phosphate acyltransferase PlsX [Candidatus Edwardsbacteria bacterium]